MISNRTTWWHPEDNGFLFESASSQGFSSCCLRGFVMTLFPFGLLIRALTRNPSFGKAASWNCFYLSVSFDWMLQCHPGCWFWNKAAGGKSKFCWRRFWCGLDFNDWVEEEDYGAYNERSMWRRMGVLQIRQIRSARTPRWPSFPHKEWEPDNKRVSR